MNGCIDPLMHVCMDAWMHGCMDAWMHVRMDAWMNGCMDEWMNGCMYAKLSVDVVDLIVTMYVKTDWLSWVRHVPLFIPYNLLYQFRFGCPLVSKGKGFKRL